mgnify:CR=1 FL=1
MLQIVVMTLLPSALLCGAIMLLACRPWSRSDVQVRGQWGAPLGLGAATISAYLMAFVALKEPLPQWVPQERWQWITIMTLAATCFGLIGAGWRPVSWERIFLCGVAAFCIAWLIQPTPRVNHPGVFKAMVGVMAFGLAMNLELISLRRRGATVPLAMAMVFGGAAMVFVQSGFARIGLLAAAPATAALVIALLARWNPSVSLCDGGGIWLGAMLAALIGIGGDSGYNTGEVPIASFVLVAVAPLMLWVGELRRVQSMQPANAAIVRIALVCVPVVIPIALTWPLTMPPI